MSRWLFLPLCSQVLDGEWDVMEHLGDYRFRGQGGKARIDVGDLADARLDAPLPWDIIDVSRCQLDTFRGRLEGGSWLGLLFTIGISGSMTYDNDTSASTTGSPHGRAPISLDARLNWLISLLIDH